MQHLKPVIDAARSLLVLELGPSGTDAWLWEHTQRIVRHARMLCRLPELEDEPPNEEVVALAGLFADGGWAIQARRGEVKPWQIHQRPTNDDQRELAIEALRQHAGPHVQAEQIDTAAETIRQAASRFTTLAEAQVLGEAQNLADCGLAHLLRQVRRHQSEGCGIVDLIQAWVRQREYRYWHSRIEERLRFEISRRIAWQRVEAAEQFIRALQQQHVGDDLVEAMRAAKIALDPPPLDLD